ncbi:hypothetical protein [Psychrobacter pygoscelis]|uniref:hypothetical protein n=1 Tax=Psychrobacter pygoscelis TaxID=2488563 RepID=UPI00103C2B8B|nr:hypothetical protein [Psychrobacter pygoscelis]
MNGDRNECLATPFHITIDARGCPASISLVGLLRMEFRAFFKSQSLSLRLKDSVDNKFKKSGDKDERFCAIDYRKNI